MQKETTRKCIVTGKVLEKEQMLRFTVMADGMVVPDFRKKLPGKGVYVVDAKSSLTKAVEANLFAKALKMKAKVDKDLPAKVETLLMRRALDLVSLARKAGDLVWGMDKVVDALKKNRVAFLLEASDAGEDGRKKLESYAKDLEIFKLFTVEELDKELAKDNTVYLALVKGKMATTVRNALVRLSDFLTN